MNDPYRILGVTYDTDDETIRKAWLEKVRRYPPEISPERFKIYREAYDAISTSAKRLQLYLFSDVCYYDSPVETLTKELEEPGRRTPPPPAMMHSLISETFRMVYTEKKRGKSNDHR